MDELTETSVRGAGRLGSAGAEDDVGEFDRLEEDMVCIRGSGRVALGDNEGRTELCWGGILSTALAEGNGASIKLLNVSLCSQGDGVNTRNVLFPRLPRRRHHTGEILETDGGYSVG